MFNRCLHLIASGLIVTACVFSQDSVDDAQLNFSFKIPNGFSIAPELTKIQPGILYAFKTVAAEGKANNVIIIKRLYGKLGTERLRPEDKPKDFNGHLTSAIWLEHEIDVMEIPEEVNGINTITLNAQIPLAKESIQMMIVGPAAEVNQLRNICGNALSGLSGPSEWDNRRNSPTGLMIAGGLNMIIVFAGAIFLWYMSKRTRKGTVFLIGLVLLLIGTAVRLSITGLLTIFAGGFQMLGVIGLILGGLDFFRRHPPVCLSSNDTDAVKPDEQIR